MKKWQSILSEHHNIIVNSDTTATVLNVFYDTKRGFLYNDHIFKVFDIYLDSEGNKYESIYDYLGY